jgi:hypothetical protein
MRLASITFLFLMLARSVIAADPPVTERFDAAVDQMNAGDWHGAASGFRSLIDERIVSGPILLNLATSLQNQGADGEARWALARAESMPDVSEEARRRGTALDRRLNQPPLAQGSRAFPAAFLWIGGLVIMSMSLIGAVFLPRIRSGIWIGAIAIALAIGGSALSEREPAIVLSDTVAFSDHQSLSVPEFSLAEGQFVRIVSRRGARAEVQTKDGFRGWVDTYTVRTF